MKVICKNARIQPLNELYSVPVNRPMLFCLNDCPICHGAGYTEMDVVAVSEVKTHIKKLREEWVEKHSCSDAYGDSCVWVNDLKDELYNFIEYIDSLKEANHD